MVYQIVSLPKELVESAYTGNTVESLARLRGTNNQTELLLLPVRLAKRRESRLLLLNHMVDDSYAFGSLWRLRCDKPAPRETLEILCDPQPHVEKDKQL